MPVSSDLARGNETIDTMLYLPTVTIPNVNSQTSANQTVTVLGVQQGDCISWNQVSNLITGLAIDNVYASAANTLTFTWTNNTAGNLTGNGTCAILLELCRSSIVPYTSLPQAIE